MRQLVMPALLTGVLFACGAPAKPKAKAAKPVDNSSYARLNQAAPVEKVEIHVEARRSGRSLVVDVHGIGRGHQSGQRLENSKEWQIKAMDGPVALKQVLAGPAKVSREPTGAAMGSQWNIDVRFMVAFAIPDRAANIALLVKAPNGEVAQEQVRIDARPQTPKAVGSLSR